MTLIMPSDYGIEMLVGSSPIVSPGFLSNSSYYSDYARCGSVWSSSANHCALSEAITTKARPLSAAFGFSPFSNFTDHPPVVTTASATTLSKNSSFRSSGRRRKNANVEAPPVIQLRPCLMSPKTADTITNNSDGSAFPSREKKKVSFADSIGKSLEVIKFFLERPDCPPKWSQEFYEKVTGGASTEMHVSKWEVTFVQPSCNYMAWKAKLENNSVALENAYVRDKEDKVTGLVKVTNMAFHKNLRIRYTSNNWISYEEVDGIFASMPNVSASYNLYDNFVFDFPLPASTTMDKIEFCIQYITDGREFWDNNEGKNYAIVAIRPRDKQTTENSRMTDAYLRSMEHWSLFTNWDDGLNERYY